MLNNSVVIVEDSNNLAAHLRQIVDAQPGFWCSAVATSVKDALTIIPACAPKLVIFDVELGDGNAFDILKALQPVNFMVIFVTAYKEYAIKAIKYGAMDYVLKPVDAGELQVAMAKAGDLMPSNAQIAVAQQHHNDPAYTGRMAIRSNGVIKLLSVADILYLEAGDATTFHMTDGQKVTSAKILKEYDEMLPSRLFYRIHASFLVNLDQVGEYRPAPYPEVVLRNQTVLPVAARRKDSLASYLIGKNKSI